MKVIKPEQAMIHYTENVMDYNYNYFVKNVMDYNYNYVSFRFVYYLPHSGLGNESVTPARYNTTTFSTTFTHILLLHLTVSYTEIS